MDSLNLTHTIILHDIPSTEILLQNLRYTGTERLRGTLSIARTLSSLTTIVFREKMFSRNTSTLHIPLRRFEDVFSQLKRYFAPSSICLHLPIPPLHELVGLVGNSGPHSNNEDLVFVKEWMESISTNLKGDQLVLHNILHIDTSVAKYFANVEIHFATYHMFNTPVLSRADALTQTFPHFYQAAFNMLCHQLPNNEYGKIEVYNATILKDIPLEDLREEAERRYPNLMIPSLEVLEERLEFLGPEDNIHDV